MDHHIHQFKKNSVGLMCFSALQCSKNRNTNEIFLQSIQIIRIMQYSPTKKGMQGEKKDEGPNDLNLFSHLFGVDSKIVSASGICQCAALLEDLGRLLSHTWADERNITQVGEQHVSYFLFPFLPPVTKGVQRKQTILMELYLGMGMWQ